MADGADEPIPSFYQEPGRPMGRSLASSHLAERIDPFTGKLQLRHVDLVVPGNGGFDLVVTRSYSSLAEAFPAYSPYGVGWTMHFGKVLRNANLAICDTGQMSPTRNPVLELPDGSRQILYVALDGVTFRTTSMWKGVCSSGTLVLYSPDATKYEFGFQGVNEGSVTHPNRSYHVSKITDRNGNWMTFTYANFGTATAVTGVSTSDGRSLTFNYSGDRLSSITDGSRTWNYAYQPSSTMMGQQYLKTVTPPAGPAWQYAYDDSAIGVPGAASIKTVTYPTGGTITYAYGFVNFAATPDIPRSIVVMSKVTSDGGSWSYTYQPATQAVSNNTSFWDSPGSNPAMVDRTTIVGPDRTEVYSHVGYNSVISGYVWAIGLLARHTIGDEQVETYGWDWIKISNQENRRPGGLLTIDGAVLAPVMTGRSIARNGLYHNTSYLGFDDYGNPTTIKESGTQLKTTNITYANNDARWMIRLKKDETIVNETTGENVGSITRTFDTNFNMLTETKFGVPTTYTYTSQGDVATRKDARNITTTYGSYYRGVPRTETQPESVTVSRVVSGVGNITSETDGENVTTGYGYDGLARLTSITHQLGNGVAVSWGTNTRTVTRGGYQETTTYDGFGRETRVEYQGAGAPVYRTTRYDAAGRAEFKSYPSSSLGMTYTYDALGRVKTIVHPSAKGGSATQQYTYALNRVEFLNARQLKYVYHYRSFADPEQKDLIGIEAPDIYANVAIRRNTLGQIKEVEQSGKIRTYNYDTRYYLTSEVNPETGTTTYGRDGNGNMTSRAVGASGTAGFTYDNRNRPSTATYPDGASVTRTYYKDDKIKTVDTGQVLQQYVYNANKSLTQQSVTVGGQTFGIGYGYDGNDALSSITYDGTRSVTYAPDALGRPTQAMPYVTSVAYHPGGATKSIAYANGVTTSFELNDRQWPKRMKVVPAGIALFDFTYGYDDNGNVTSIQNSTDASYDRTLGYDATDRLSSASGPWGTGTFVYDGRSNIHSQRLGAKSISYTYDGTTDRLTGVSGTTVAAYTYDTYGNVTGNGTDTFAYSDRANMRCANCGLPNEQTFTYDGDNLRVRTVKGGVATYFVNGLGGKLLWEKTPMNAITDYIYLGNHQVATRRQGISTP